MSLYEESINHNKTANINNNVYEFEQNMLESAFGDFANIINMESSIASDEIDDDAYKSINYVLENNKIQVDIRYPNNLNDISYNRVVDILCFSQIKFRAAVLPNKWWKKDIGSFIAFKKDSQKAVAVVLTESGKYKIFEPESSTVYYLEQNMTKLFKEDIVIIFRTFPDKVIKIRDISKFVFLSVKKRDIISVVLTGVIVGILTMILPFSIGKIFDKAIPSGSTNIIIQIAFLLISVELSSFFFKVTQLIGIQRLNMYLFNGLMHAIWDKLLGLPAIFFRKFSSGEMNTRLYSIFQIGEIFSEKTLQTLLEGLFLLFNLGLMFYYNKILTLFSLFIIIIIVSVNFIISIFVYRIETQKIQIRNKLYGIIYQLLRGITKIKVANAENRAFCIWAKEFSRLQRLSFRGDYFRNILTTFSESAFIASTSIIFFIAIQYSNNSMTVGSFIAFFGAFSMLIKSFLAISTNILSVAMIFPLYDAARPILSEVRESQCNKPSIKDIKGNICVENVSFRYDVNAPLTIKNASLSINEGEYVAFVGASGSGKSTMLRLLLGFEKPEKGTIYYEGKDIRNIDIVDLRRHLGVVLQNGNLISGSIFQSIVGQNSKMTIDDAWEVAKLCGISDDIENMPMGMHTIINEQGDNISGGQRQRLILARALSKKPKIILLDEATSALDNISQEIIGRNLRESRMTRIVIAHRISTIADCDRIYVMKNGEIVEKGNFIELMVKKGEFYKLAKIQTDEA